VYEAGILMQGETELHGEKSGKVSWECRLVSIQPRIRLLRSFDQRSHSYLGYCLAVQDRIAYQEGEFSVGIGKGAQAKHQFRVGDTVKGQSWVVSNPRTEPVEFYKTSALKLIERGQIGEESTPPWQGIPPEFEVYRECGHRRLDARTYEKKCKGCVWGCRMAVEMIVNQWNPASKKYRFETFCYGPKSCPLYAAGPTRKVPGRSGMTWEEEDWVDEEATAHRGEDE